LELNGGKKSKLCGIKPRWGFNIKPDPQRGLMPQGSEF